MHDVVPAEQPIIIVMVVPPAIAFVLLQVIVGAPPAEKEFSEQERLPA